MRELDIRKGIVRASAMMVLATTATVGILAASPASAVEFSPNDSFGAQKEVSATSSNVTAAGWVDVAAYYYYQDCINASAAFPSGYAYCHWVGGTAPWHLAVWIS